MYLSATWDTGAFVALGTLPLGLLSLQRSSNVEDAFNDKVGNSSFCCKKLNILLP